MLSKERFFDSLLEYARENSPYEPPHFRPFIHLVLDGKLTVDQLRWWAENKYYGEYHVPNVFAALLAKCNDPDWRRILAKVIAEEVGTGGRAHDELWADVGVALGVPRERVSPDNAIKRMREIGNEPFHGRIRGILEAPSFEIALCYAMGVAMTSPGLSAWFPRLRDSLERNYGIRTETLEYFKEEETADHQRGLLAKRLVLDYAERNGAHDQVEKALRHTIDLTRARHQAMEDAVLSRR